MRVTLSQALLASGAVLGAACSRPAAVPSQVMPATAPATAPEAKPKGPTTVYQEGIGLDSADFVAFSRDGALFATSDRTSVAIYDTPTGRRRATLRMQNDGMVFSPDGAALLIVTGDKLAPQLWNLRDGSRRALEQPKSSLEPCYGAFCPRFVAGGTRLVAAVRDGLLIFDLGTGKILAEFERTEGWAAAGRLVAVVHEQGLDLIDAESGARRHRLSPETLGQPQIVEIDEKGTRVAAGGQDKKVRFIDAGSGKVTATSPDFKREITWLSWHPTEAKVAVGLDWGLARIFSDRDSIEQVVGNWGKIHSIGWSASGDRMVVRSPSTIAALDGMGSKKLASARSLILSAASADGRLALTVDESEDPLTLVDLETGKPRYSLDLPQRLRHSGAGRGPGSRVSLGDLIIDVATCQISKAVETQRRGTDTPGSPARQPAAKPDEEIDIPDRRWQAYSPPSPDKRYVVAGKFGDCKIGPITASCTCLYDLSQKRCEKPLMPVSAGLSEVDSWSWSPDGKLLSHADSSQGVLDVLAVPSGAAVAKLPLEWSIVHYWIGPQTLILFGAAESLRVWRLSDRATLNLHVRKIHDKPYLIAVREDGRWDGDKELLPYVALRESPDLRAPVRLLSEAPASLRHAGLCAAFLAGNR